MDNGERYAPKARGQLKSNAVIVLVNADSTFINAVNAANGDSLWSWPIVTPRSRIVAGAHGVDGGFNTARSSRKSSPSDHAWNGHPLGVNGSTASVISGT